MNGKIASGYSDMKEEQMYWNPLLETLPAEKIRQLQLKKFKKIFTWAYKNSRFHRDLYQKARIKPGDIQTFEEITQIPSVDKSMMRNFQGKNPFPYGEALCVPLEEVTAFRQTSGTTGLPVYQPDTWQDWEWWTECWAYVLWAQDFRPSDRVFIPFGYNVFVAFWAGHYGAEKIGCEVIPGGALDTQARILKIQELKPTALMATPSYVLGMAATARDCLGLNPSSLAVEKITCAGEPGALISSTKRRMEESWGAKVYDHAGATEIGAWGYECTAQPGGMHVNEAMFLVEIEDTETGKTIQEPEKKGKMIITALDRLAQPCVRFDSKDLIEWSPDPCPCGRSFRLVNGGVQGRVDDLIKVKGVLLAPSAVEEVVRAFPELSDDFEVAVGKKGDLDQILLKVELKPDYQEHRESLKNRLKNQLRITTNLGFLIELKPYGSLPRYDIKARRFKDLRYGNIPGE